MNTKSLMRLLGAALKQSEPLGDLASDTLKVLPRLDDSPLQLGDGTTSWDLLLYGGSASAYVSFDASANRLKFEDNVELHFGTGATAGLGAAGDIQVRWDGTDLDVLQLTANSSISWGVDGAGIDQIWYGDTASAKMTWDQSADALIFSGLAYLYGQKTRVQAKTADYTLAATDSGSVLTTRGAAGAVNFTLPTVAAGLAGTDVLIYVAADQNVTLTAQTNGQLVLFNDAAANTVALSTASEKVGGCFRVICDGTSWLVIPLLWPDVGGAAQTATVTT